MNHPAIPPIGGMSADCSSAVAAEAVAGRNRIAPSSPESTPSAGPSRRGLLLGIASIAPAAALAAAALPAAAETMGGLNMNAFAKITSDARLVAGRAHPDAAILDLEAQFNGINEELAALLDKRCDADDARMEAREAFEADNPAPQMPDVVPGENLKAIMAEYAARRRVWNENRRQALEEFDAAFERLGDASTAAFKQRADVVEAMAEIAAVSFLGLAAKIRVVLSDPDEVFGSLAVSLLEDTAAIMAEGSAGWSAAAVQRRVVWPAVAMRGS